MAEELDARVGALEARLELLLTAMASEVRSRRVAVVDEHGVERLRLSAEFGAGTVMARLPGPEGATTGVELYAAEHGGGQFAIGVALLRNGELVCRWEG